MPSASGLMSFIALCLTSENESGRRWPFTAGSKPTRRTEFHFSGSALNVCAKVSWTRAGPCGFGRPASCARISNSLTPFHSGRSSAAPPSSAVVSAHVAPHLQIMRSRNVPATKLRCLVLEEPEAHRLRDLPEKVGEIQIGRCVVGGIATENKERLYGPGFDRGFQVADGAGRLLIGRRAGMVAPIFPSAWLIAWPRICTQTGCCSPTKTILRPRLARRSLAHAEGQASSKVASIFGQASTIEASPESPAEADTWLPSCRVNSPIREALQR